MKPLSYYQETSVSIPRLDDYTTAYYYKKGVMVGIKKPFDPDFEPPEKWVEEKDLDETSYSSHLELYREENVRLQNEFRKDLIEKYNMTDHPKADAIFNKAWDMGSSSGLGAIDYYFADLVELFEQNS